MLDYVFPSSDSHRVDFWISTHRQTRGITAWKSASQNGYREGCNSWQPTRLRVATMTRAGSLTRAELAETWAIRRTAVLTMAVTIVNIGSRSATFTTSLHQNSRMDSLTSCSADGV